MDELVSYQLGEFMAKINTYDCTISLMKFDDEESHWFKAENCLSVDLNLQLKRLLLEKFPDKPVTVSFKIKEIKKGEGIVK